MPRNGVGGYALPASNPVVTGTQITTTWANPTMADIAAELTNSMARDGQSPATANIPMGGYKLTGLGAATARDHAMPLGQLADGALQHLTSVSGGDAITAVLSPAPVNYVAGQVFLFIAAGTNTTSTPTLNINGLGAKNIMSGVSAPNVGAISAGSIVYVAYDGASFQIIAMAGDFASTASGKGATMIGRGLPVVDSIATLRTLLKTSAATRAFVTGYYTAGDGGGGPYYYDAADTTSTDNGGTIIVAADGGRWKLVYTGSLSILQFGARTGGAVDNATAFAAAASYLASFGGTTETPRLLFPAGTYAYSACPNWAIQNLVMDCSLGVFFKYTGAGVAFNLDGGASGSGVYGFRLLGMPTIKGNASALYGIYCRALHHSCVEAVIRDVSTAGLITFWCVSSEFTIRISPVGVPAFSPAPAKGMVLDKRGAGEMTSNCTFYTPIVEGCTNYGIDLENAVQCIFVGGTSESNVGGIFVSATSTYNTFLNTDLEFNTTTDVFCQGSYNNFLGVLSSTTSTFSGTSNLITAGVYNTIAVGGVDNEFHKTHYSANAGTFTDTGSGTIKRSVRNITSNTLDAELQRNPQKLFYIDGPASNNTIVGSDDQVTGGSANDVAFYHYGSGKIRMFVGASTPLQIGGGNTLGFFGTAPAVKPTITGSRGGNAALASLLTALAGIGLITDATTV